MTADVIFVAPDMSNKKLALIGVAIILPLLFSSCAKVSTSRGKHADKIKQTAALTFVGEGNASWYGYHWKGRRTASGERFDPTKLTAAHRTLPFGSVVRVTNLANGKTCDVKINDRGPSKKSRRIIDLSREAARQLDFLGKGVTKVRLEIIEDSSNVKSQRTKNPAGSRP